jgi:hypothetical protein
MSGTKVDCSFVIAVCKTVGLQPELVRDLLIHAPADGFTTLDVRMIVTHVQAETITKELEKKGVVVNIFAEKEEK